MPCASLFVHASLFIQCDKCYSTIFIVVLWSKVTICLIYQWVIRLEPCICKHPWHCKNMIPLLPFHLRQLIFLFHGSLHMVLQHLAAYSTYYRYQIIIGVGHDSLYLPLVEVHLSPSTGNAFNRGHCWPSLTSLRWWGNDNPSPIKQWKVMEQSILSSTSIDKLYWKWLVSLMWTIVWDWEKQQSLY